MNAVQLLKNLKAQGFTLRVLEGGQLRVSPKLPAEVREVVKHLKPELLMLLHGPEPDRMDSQLKRLATTHPNNWPRLEKCPHCQKGLVTCETGDYSLAQCPGDGTHFIQLRNKRRKEPMGFFLERREDVACSDCEIVTITTGGRCTNCWQLLCLIPELNCGHTFSFWRLRSETTWHCTGCELPESSLELVCYSE